MTSPPGDDLALAKEAALRAGMVLLRHFERRVQGERSAGHKGEVDLVTDADLEAERTIVEIFRQRRPGDGILAEESANGDPRAARRLWIVDPLDGTTNFAHAVPHFAVSIALREEGRAVAGVVYAPVAGELFEAALGRGALLSRIGAAWEPRRTEEGAPLATPIRVSTVSPLRQALSATGFPYDRHVAEDDNSAEHRAFMKAAQGVRRMGAAALDLAWVACGRYDAYWEMKLAPWDMAAGALLVTEAGGRVTGYRGEPFDPFSPFVAASNGLVHDEMLAVLARARH